MEVPVVSIACHLDIGRWRLKTVEGRRSRRSTAKLSQRVCVSKGSKVKQSKVKKRIVLVYNYKDMGQSPTLAHPSVSL